MADDVYQSFEEALTERNAQSLTINTTFLGIREVIVQEAQFDTSTREAEITVRFVAELKSFVRNAQGDIVDGSETEVKRQRDAWTFARATGSDDPNWLLVATGD